MVGEVARDVWMMDTTTAIESQGGESANFEGLRSGQGRRQETRAGESNGSEGQN